LRCIRENSSRPIMFRVCGVSRASIVRDDHLLDVDVAAHGKVPKTDFPAQPCAARRQVLHRLPRVGVPGRLAERERNLRQREQRRAGEGGTEKNESAVAHVAQDLENKARPNPALPAGSTPGTLSTGLHPSLVSRTEGNRSPGRNAPLAMDSAISWARASYRFI
jgi:hypothetical protein